MISPIKTVYAIEVSGVCNLTKKCVWCPMHTVKRNRGMMSAEVVKRTLHWVEKLDKMPDLALHNFGEPLLHPEFDVIALEFSKLTKVNFSTNATYLDEKWADRLAKVPFEWISLSPWDMPSVYRAEKLLVARGVQVKLPPGITHNFAGQAKGPNNAIYNKCPFIVNGRAVVRWNGDVADCCISDRDEDKIGTVFQEPEDVKMRWYSICDTCHHNAS